MPAVDPVSMLAGIIRSEFPTAKIEQCMAVAFDCVEAIKNMPRPTNVQPTVIPQTGAAQL